MFGASDGCTRLQGDDCRIGVRWLSSIQLSAPEYAVVDLRFDDGCGLDVVAALKRLRPEACFLIKYMCRFAGMGLKEGR
jgi:ActR/RegA family two-component response regulator